VLIARIKAKLDGVKRKGIREKDTDNTNQLDHGHQVTIPRGGTPKKIWVGVCGLLPKTPSLFMTKICDIPYPIYDQNL